MDFGTDGINFGVFLFGNNNLMILVFFFFSLLVLLLIVLGDDVLFGFDIVGLFVFEDEEAVVLFVDNKSCVDWNDDADENNDKRGEVVGW